MQGTDNLVKQIQNEAWPIVVVAVCSILLPLLAVAMVIIYYIKRNSYIKQKPKYEELKRGSNGSYKDFT